MQHPLERIVLFANDAKQGMAKFEFKRGCLIGNLNQEISHLDEPMIDRIKLAYANWQALIEQCLVDAKQQSKFLNHQIVKCLLSSSGLAGKVR